MNIKKEDYPILNYIENMKLTDKIHDMLNDSGYDDEGINDIKLSLDFFIGETLQIEYAPISLHKKLLNTNNFIEAKHLLRDSLETTGLLLLPETILPDFSHVPDYVDVDAHDYPINAILYSWLAPNNHDKISKRIELEDLRNKIAQGKKEPLGADWTSLMETLEDEDDVWDEMQNANRNLLILPIDFDRITQATRQSELIAYSEEYGLQEERENWYNKIHNYVMSFLLYYNSHAKVGTNIVYNGDIGILEWMKFDNNSLN